MSFEGRIGVVMLCHRWAGRIRCETRRTPDRLVIRWLCSCALILCASSPRGLAAQYPGAIAGTVTDAVTRAPLEGASITLVQTAFAALSDAAGRFHLRG